MKYLLTALLATASFCSQAGTDIVYSPRSEIYSIRSLTISDKQFLLGDKNGKEATVNGILRFPPKPVVFLCGMRIHETGFFSNIRVST